MQMDRRTAITQRRIKGPHNLSEVLEALKDVVTSGRDEQLTIILTDCVGSMVFL